MFMQSMLGSGAGATSGILQGLITGQQARHDNQRMDWMQDQLNEQRVDKAKLAFNEAAYNTELGGDPEEINAVMKQYPDLFLTENKAFGQEGNMQPQFLPSTISRINSHNVVDEFGAKYSSSIDGEIIGPPTQGGAYPLAMDINREHFNMVQALKPDITLTDEMFNDEQQYKDYLEGGMLLKDVGEDGSTTKIPMTMNMLAMGAPNYAAYRKKRIQDDMLTQAKINNQLKPQAQSAYMQVFNQWQNATGESKEQLEQQLNQLSTDKPTELTQLFTARDALDPSVPKDLAKVTDINKRIKKLTEYAPQKTPAAIIVDMYKDEKAKDLGQQVTTNLNQSLDTPISTQDSDLETQVRGDKSRYTTKIQTLEDEARGAQRTIAAAQQLQKLVDDPNYDTGFVENALNYLAKVAPDDIMEASTEQIMADASVNQFTAQVLKDLSGLAASDQEAMRTMLQTVGSPEFQESVKRKTLKNYTTNVAKKLLELRKQLSDVGLPVTAKNLAPSVVEEPAQPKAVDMTLFLK